LISVELAPEVTAAPYSTYVRGVIIDGDSGVLLTGSGKSALVFEG
jgi:hypothetical protein